MEFEDLISKLDMEIEYAKNNYVPIIRHKSAKLLYDFVKENSFKNVLEIGTAIGFSGSIIMSASQNKLTTIDINNEYLDMANRTFEKLGLKDRVKIFSGDAWDIIQEFANENLKFDMIFLDGAKGQYIKYLDVLSNLLTDNGVIFADNVLLQGMVESEEKIPHKKRTMVVNLRKYLDKVFKYPYETKLIRLEDGIAITKVKRR